MDIKDTAKRIFEEIQINKDIKKGFDGLTPQMRYYNTEKGRKVNLEASKRYQNTEAGRARHRENQRRYRERLKLLKTQSENP